MSEQDRSRQLEEELRKEALAQHDGLNEMGTYRPARRFYTVGPRPLSYPGRLLSRRLSLHVLNGYLCF